jgi:hypothetical protein
MAVLHSELAPDKVPIVVVQSVSALDPSEQEALLDGYRQMAADEEREAEAEEWCEALIGDSFVAR